MDSYGTNLSNSHSPNCNSLISSASHDEIKPRCACGAKATIRIVRKKGGNFGKLFWGCRNFMAAYVLSFFVAEKLLLVPEVMESLFLVILMFGV
ncbi:hypothetical protein KIW84_036017 [Lathyrus oleraceus]|uniref:GRF-type domain-containing protein n=1 Tax=Pisum sativum TaxID=3888 RepID=A0A9D4Y726_PEA|nr:hypothetical protein KIW84_036017 [Pisum sativum]